MNVDKRENYGQEDQYFQDDETRYKNERQYDDVDIDAPPADHIISETADPDYGNDFAEDEISSQRLDNQNPARDTFDEGSLNDDEFDDDGDLDDGDLDDGDLDDGDLEDGDLDDEDALEDDELDEDDETGADPNRNL